MCFCDIWCISEAIIFLPAQWYNHLNWETWWQNRNFFFCTVVLRLQVFDFTQAKYTFFIGLHAMLSPLLNFQLSFFWVNVELLLFTKYLLILYDIEFWLNSDTRLELQDRHFGLVLLSSWFLCWMFNSNNLLCSGVVHCLFELSPMPASIITWFI